MMEFACIHVVSPMQSYEIICVHDTPIFHAMCCILGASIPQKLELEPKDLVGKRLPLTPDIVTKSSDLTIVTSVPSQLILHEKAFRQHQADVQVVCVLLPERTFVMSRNDSTIIEDVALMLFHHQDYCDSNFVFRDLGGNVLDKSDQCPDAIFAFDRIPASVHDIINKVDIRFDKHHLIFRACAKVEVIEAFLHFVKAQGILDFIRAIGWDFRPITAFQVLPMTVCCCVFQLKADYPCQVMLSKVSFNPGSSVLSWMDFDLWDRRFGLSCGIPMFGRDLCHHRRKWESFYGLGQSHVKCLGKTLSSG